MSWKRKIREEKEQVKTSEGKTGMGRNVVASLQLPFFFVNIHLTSFKPEPRGLPLLTTQVPLSRAGLPSGLLCALRPRQTLRGNTFNVLFNQTSAILLSFVNNNAQAYLQVSQNVEEVIGIANYYLINTNSSAMFISDQGFVFNRDLS